MSKFFTITQIMITKLTALKTKVPRYFKFTSTEDNWAAIDAQLDVIQNDLQLSEISSKYGDNDDTTSAAIAARSWLDGTGMDLEKGWLMLLDLNQK